jgi:hypothetical protein
LFPFTIRSEAIQVNNVSVPSAHLNPLITYVYINIVLINNLTHIVRFFVSVNKILTNIFFLKVFILHFALDIREGTLIDAAIKLFLDNHN